MGTEVDWCDMKAECLPSFTLGTFTGTLVSLIGQLGTEHHTLLSKHEPNLFPSGQYAIMERIHRSGEPGTGMAVLSSGCESFYGQR